MTMLLVADMFQVDSCKFAAHKNIIFVLEFIYLPIILDVASMAAECEAINASMVFGGGEGPHG